MAKTDIVKGKSISNILELSIKDLENLSRSDLSKTTSRLVSAANKRINRLLKQGFTDVPALFSVKGLNKKQLLNKFKETSKFLKEERSTLKGRKAILKRINKTLKEKGYSTIKFEDSTEFWKIYAKLRDESELFEKYKYNTWEVINNYIEMNDDINIDELRSDVLEEIFGNE